METKKRIGIWIRVSTDRQVEGDSPEHHKQRAQHYIDSKEGWQAIEVYQLDAMSGKSITDYAETKRMLADIKSGHITGLVFSKLARVARNVRELLDLADYFNLHRADLISLGESIDTSSPAGRLFYTLLAAMAQFEREETASRVAASVPVRARMGKSLGGQAAYGYKWEGNSFVVNPDEAPVRKLMYELFLRHQRKQRVAKVLNKQGYRTRNGSLFTATSISRLLRDSTAKGQRRANYTKSEGKNRGWQVKPKEDWIFTPCEPIVSEELWNDCNRLLDEQESSRTPIGPKAVYLLSGFVTCGCGRKMYVYQHSKNYACKACKTRIAVDDLDEIYQVYLKEYLGSINPVEYLARGDEQLQEKKQLLASTQSERAKLSKRIAAMLHLRLDGDMSKEQFNEHYKPLEERIAQLDAQLPELEAEVDVRAIQLQSTDIVMSEARALYDQWAEMPFDQKRGIVEMITGSIEIGKEDITINLAYAPAIPSNAENSSHHLKGS